MVLSYPPGRGSNQAMRGMAFASVSVEDRESEEIPEILAAQIRRQLQGNHVDLLVLFFTPHYYHDIHRIAEGLRDELTPQVLIGVSSEGVIDRTKEYELVKSLVVFAGAFPGASFYPFHLQPPFAEFNGDEFAAWVSAAGFPDSQKVFFLFADPFSAPMDYVLSVLDDAFSGVPVAGGMASGALRPGGNYLLLNDAVYHDGVVGLGIAGDFRADVIVSGSCRPVGKPVVVTEMDGNRIVRVEDETPLNWVQETVRDLPPREQDLIREGMFIGRVVVNHHGRYGQGDFLIHGVLNVDWKSGTFSVSGQVRTGDILRIHVRDAQAADADLTLALTPQLFHKDAAGALLFVSNGRGTRLYDHLHGDVTVVRRSLGNIPLAGTFCAGEIAPIGMKNYLQSHTISMVVFRPGNEKTGSD